MVEVPALLQAVLVVVAIAVGVRFVAAGTTLPYTVLLVGVGAALSIGPAFPYEAALSPLFTHDVILYLFIPAIVFQGAAAIDAGEFRRNLPVFGSMVVVGLPLAVFVLGWLGTFGLDLPLLLSLLFAAMVYPVDPVAVLSLYDEMGAPERLSVITEGESLLDDGFAIVLFSSVLAVVEGATGSEMTGAGLLSPRRLGSLVVDFLVVSAGGVLVGVVVSYAVYWVQRRTDDHMTLFMLTLVAAYGSFLVAEHLLHVSGVLAAVAAGLLLGSHGEEHAVSERQLRFLEDTWRAFVFLLNTVLFLVIGVEVTSDQLLAVAPSIGVAFLLVLAVRAGVVYGVTGALTLVVPDQIPLKYRHVLVWSGLHGVIPVALALSLGPTVPRAAHLRTLVFGVVIASMLVQGLLMPKVLRVTGVAGGE